MKHHEALIGFGQVRHVRRRPAVHAFHYGAYFLMLPMRSIQKQSATKEHRHFDLPINRAGLLSFHDMDHGDGRLPEQGGAMAWLTEILDKDGNLTAIEFFNELGSFEFQSLWDPTDEQTSENRDKFRNWSYRMAEQQNYEVLK